MVDVTVSDVLPIIDSFDFMILLVMDFTELGATSGIVFIVLSLCITFSSVDRSSCRSSIKI